MADRRYFKVGRKLLPLIQEWQREGREVIKRRNKLGEELGAEKMQTSQFGGQEHVHGFCDVKTPKPGWRSRKHKKHGYTIFVPNLRTKAGKEAAKRLQACTSPIPTALFKAVGITDRHVYLKPTGGSGYTVHYPHVEKIGRAWIVSIGSGCSGKSRYKPHKHLTEIKEWQYMKLVDESKGKRKSRARRKVMV